MTTVPWLRRMGQFTSSNSPTILSGFAVAGVITTAYLAAKAAPTVKAHLINVWNDKIAENYTGEPDDVDDAAFELTPAEVIKGSWKFYIPAAISGAVTISCIIGANRVGVRREAALVGAYALATAAFDRYKDEVLEQIGTQKEEKIRASVAQKQVEANPPSPNQVIMAMDGGKTLCYETFTGRYFQSDVESIRRAQNDINEQILNGDYYASHDEFCSLLGLGRTLVGTQLGWNGSHLVNVRFESVLTDDKQPALAIEYVKNPIADYTNF